MFRHLGDLDLVFSGGHWLGGLGNVAVPRSDSDTGAILRFLAEKNGIETSKTSTIVCVWSHKDRFQEHLGVYSVHSKIIRKYGCFLGLISVPKFPSWCPFAKAQQRGHILGIEIALVEINRETCRVLWSHGPHGSQKKITKFLGQIPLNQNSCWVNPIE